MIAAKKLEGGRVAPKIIGAPPPRVSAAQRAGSADLGASGYRLSSNVKGPPLRNERQGASQADAGTGVGLAGVVTPQKQNKAALTRDNWRKKKAGNVSDDEAEPAPLGVERAQRPAKMAETEGRAPPATKASRTAVRVGAKAKAIKEINLEESDDEGAQAWTGADCSGKTQKGQGSRGG
jgi:hypothetical protein